MYANDDGAESNEACSMEDRDGSDETNPPEETTRPIAEKQARHVQRKLAFENVSMPKNAVTEPESAIDSRKKNVERNADENILSPSVRSEAQVQINRTKETGKEIQVTLQDPEMLKRSKKRE